MSVQKRIDYTYITDKYHAFGFSGMHTINPDKEKVINFDFENSNSLLFELINHHYALASEIIEKCDTALCIYPDFLEILISYPEFIRFQKQIFLLSQHKEFNRVFNEISRGFTQVIKPSFRSYYHIKLKDLEFDAMWVTYVEMWFAQHNIFHRSVEKLIKLSDKVVKELKEFRYYINLNRTKGHNF